MLTIGRSSGPQPCSHSRSTLSRSEGGRKEMFAEHTSTEVSRTRGQGGRPRVETVAMPGTRRQDRSQGSRAGIPEVRSGGVRALGLRSRQHPVSRSLVGGTAQD